MTCAAVGWRSKPNLRCPKLYRPSPHRELGLKVKQSNLCAEIMLHTGKDHQGLERTAVCCLSSVNAETFLEWRDHPTFIEDVMRFLDNVLEDFITRAPPEMKNAVYAARRERSVLRQQHRRGRAAPSARSAVSTSLRTR